jgi:hypothetical protein
MRNTLSRRLASLRSANGGLSLVRERLLITGRYNNLSSLAESKGRPTLGSQIRMKRVATRGSTYEPGAAISS